MPFWVDGEMVFRCPLTFITPFSWEMIKAFSFYEKAILPNGKGWIEESNKFAFEEMGLKRIELYVEADNKKSRHVTEKLGYILDRFDPIKQKYYYYMDRK